MPELTVTQMQILLLQRGFKGRSLLSIMALEGDKASYEALLGALRTGLSPDQMRCFHVLLKKTISRSRQPHVMIIHYRDTSCCT